MHEAGLVCRIRKAYKGRHVGNNPHKAIAIIMERFFGTLKDALVVNEPLTDASLLQASLKQWMVRYNHQRTHSTLAGLTPAEFKRTESQKLAHKTA